MMTRTMAPTVYDIAARRMHHQERGHEHRAGRRVPGAGRPEAVAAMERAMDLFAIETGIDPVEVRRKNLLPRFTEPHTTPMGAVYDVGDFEGALDAVLERAELRGAAQGAATAAQSW